MREPTILKLSEPVFLMNNQIDTLTIRQPRGKDLMATGNPLKMISGQGNGDQSRAVSMQIDDVSMANLIARLSNVTLTAIEDLAAPDFLAASHAVMEFLSPAENATES